LLSEKNYAEEQARQEKQDLFVKKALDDFENNVANFEKIFFMEEAAFSKNKIKNNLKNIKLSELLAEKHKQNMTKINSNGTLKQVAGIWGWGIEEQQTSSGTVSLDEKKRFYNNNFDEWEQLFVKIQTSLEEVMKNVPQNERVQSLIQRYKKCLNHLNELREIVGSF